ncbi:hypothetical protein E4U12_001697 [Claviceps purpurea]|nr:hypothetical protein E4U12_001697 [Claviceps purpurea]
MLPKLTRLCIYTNSEVRVEKTGRLPSISTKSLTAESPASTRTTPPPAPTKRGIRNGRHASSFAAVPVTHSLAVSSSGSATASSSPASGARVKMAVLSSEPSMSNGGQNNKELDALEYSGARILERREDIRVGPGKHPRHHEKDSVSHISLCPPFNRAHNPCLSIYQIFPSKSSRTFCVRFSCKKEDAITLCSCGNLERREDIRVGPGLLLVLETPHYPSARFFIEPLPILLTHPAINKIASRLFYEDNMFVLSLLGSHGQHVWQCLDDFFKDELSHSEASQSIDVAEGSDDYREGTILTMWPALRRIRFLEIRRTTALRHIYRLRRFRVTELILEKVVQALPHVRAMYSSQIQNKHVVLVKRDGTQSCV